MMNTISSSGGYSAAMMGGMPSMRPDPSQLAADLFSTADSNNDGSISQAEFTSLLQSNDSSASSDAINNLFSQLDSNGDGSLSSQETSDAVNKLFEQMRQSMANGQADMPPPPPPGGGAEGFMQKADSNQDGSLSKDEFTAALQNGNGSTDTARIDAMFSEADTNGDGTISQDELKTAMASHRGHHHGQAGAADSDGDNDGSSAGTTDTASNGSSQVSMLIQALLAQYSSDNQSSSSTLSTSA